MSSTTQVIDINNDAGSIIKLEWLSKAEIVHRQLRPHLPDSYIEKMKRVFADGGRMCVAIRDQSVVGVAVYRIYENTASGVHMYVDDLVTDENKRSSGVGKMLMDHLQIIAAKANCENFTLDSGTHRQQAHKFYFRDGMTIVAFHFLKKMRKAE